MREILQHKKFQSVDSRGEHEEAAAEINEMLTKHFFWLINDNIEEFQRLYKFWNKKFMRAIHSLIQAL